MVDQKINDDDLLRLSYETLFNASSEGIMLFDKMLKVIAVNSRFTELFGYDIDDIKGENADSFICSDSERKEKNKYIKAVISGKVCEEKSIRHHKNGESVEVLIKGIPVQVNNEIKGGYLIYYDRKEVREEARENETPDRKLIDTIPDSYFRCSTEGIIVDAQIKYGSYSSFGTLKFKYDSNLIGRDVGDLFPADVAEKIFNAMEEACKSGDLQVFECHIDGDDDYFFEIRVAKSVDEEVIILIRDISDSKKYEEKFNYLCFHDQLTGLNNRAYFGHELKRLDGSREHPISIILIDMDGVKLVNDTLGHEVGDALLKAGAAVLKQSLRHSDILARTGGDEFVAILPRTDLDIGKGIIQRIHNQADLHSRKNNSLPLSFSMGIAVANDKEYSLDKVYIEADEIMSKNKIKKGIAIKTYLVDTMIKALGVKDYVEQGHCYRVNLLAQAVGKKIGVKSKQLAKLELLAQVHDIGKVGIPDEILFKKEKLTENESKFIYQHTEKGYRIASASPQTSSVADLILKHHENWDGSGYPLGISGKEIPIECRIMLVVDSFDVMTSERSYSEPKSVEEAICELKLYSGTRYDPKIVEAMVESVKEKQQ